MNRAIVIRHVQNCDQVIQVFETATLPNYYVQRDSVIEITFRIVPSPLFRSIVIIQVRFRSHRQALPFHLSFVSRTNQRRVNTAALARWIKLLIPGI